MSTSRYQGSVTRFSVGWTSTALGRLTIRHEVDRKSGFVGEIVAGFNPNRITFSGGAAVNPRVTASPESDSASVELTEYTYQPTTLRISLLFDTTEDRDDPNVLKQTTQVVALLRPLPRSSRSPLCQLWWGSYTLLQGVLTGLSQEYTLFHPDGTPVRATLDCTFTESGESDLKLSRRSGGAGSRFCIVRLGDTLQTISSRVYGTPARWRDIALYNGLANPRALFPGQLLLLPAR